MQDALARLRELWAEMDPSLYGPSPPTLRPLDETRTEFVWKGPPLLFDRVKKTVSRSGTVLATFDALKWIGISEHRSYESPRSWSVFLQIGVVRNIRIGNTEDQTDASLAAAHIATITGKQVRVI
jgi:hypothetical protein